MVIRRLSRLHDIKPLVSAVRAQQAGFAVEDGQPGRLQAVDEITARRKETLI